MLQFYLFWVIGLNKSVKLIDILTALELKIALLARLGLKRWEIAYALNIGEGTVKSQQDRITSKLGTNWKEREDLSWPELSNEIKETIKLLNKEADYTDELHEQGKKLFQLNLFKEMGIGEPKKYFLHKRFQGLLYISGGLRFWTRPALEYLKEQRIIKLEGKNDEEEPYNPEWLKLIGVVRVRDVNAGIYLIKDYTFVQNYLDAWKENELANYVEWIHGRLLQRWQALELISREFGREIGIQLPNKEMLLNEALSVLDRSEKELTFKRML